MTIEFQKNILRYLFQNKTYYLDYLTSEIFDDVSHKALFEIYWNYMKKYHKVPDKANYLEFIAQQPGISDEAINGLKNNLYWLYEPLEDMTMVEEILIGEVKKKMFKNLTLSAMTSLDAGITSEDIDQIHKRLSKIVNLKDHDVDSGLFLFKDLNKSFRMTESVYPTFLEGLNRMTALGGFHPPQVVCIMKPPKSFGTGFMIKLAAEYAKDGLDIFYADFENGKFDIHLRFKQCLLECKIDEVYSYNSELQQIKEKLLGNGCGDIYIKEYMMKKDHFGHIETDLNKIMDEHHIIPQIMFYDYIDIMGCKDKKITETRLKIQANYADAKYINSKYGTFCFTPSKMTADGWNKEWPDMNDIAEDREKLYNAHAVFAWMRGEEDAEKNTGSIIPMLQRKGVSFLKTRVYLTVDPVNFIIEEEKI